MFVWGRGPKIFKGGKIKFEKKILKGIIDAQRTENAKAISQVISVSDAEIENIKEKIQKNSDVSEPEILNLKKDIILKTYAVEEKSLEELGPVKDEWFKTTVIRK